MEGLKKHVADCAITGAMSGYRLGLYNATTHLDATTVSWGPYVLFANRAAWERFDPKVRDFLTAQIDELSGKLWQATEQETEEGVACLTGHGTCNAGSPASMKLVPITDDDRKLVRQSFIKVVSPRWSDRCGAACIKNWNETIGRQFDLTVAASH